MTERADLATDTWEGDRSRRWVAQSAGLERQLAPVGELLFAAAALRPGEAVLDVGCGTGPTTYEAAALVGPEGRVAGVDISATMLEAARAVDAESPIEWITEDVTTWDGGDRRFDAVISRYGAMFFDDPPRAFTNLAGMTVPGGRLAMTVWQQRPASEMFELPLSVAMRTLADAGVEVPEPPLDQGPFSLSDRVAVTTMLGAAGWVDVEWAPHELTLSIGGGLPPAEAATSSMELGPTRVVTEDVDEEKNGRVLAAITEEYGRHTDENGHVRLGAAIVVVTARRPEDG